MTSSQIQVLATIDRQHKDNRHDISLSQSSGTIDADIAIIYYIKHVSKNNFSSNTRRLRGWAMAFLARHLSSFATDTF